MKKSNLVSLLLIITFLSSVCQAQSFGGLGDMMKKMMAKKKKAAHDVLTEEELLKKQRDEKGS